VTASRTAITPFSSGDLGSAGALLAERHRRHRLAEPLLEPSYEDPLNARAAIEVELAAERAGGWVARRDGEVVGYLIGQQKSPTWGPNVWVEAAGHAASEASVLRELYAVAAAAWVGEGRTNHHVLVPATDTELVDAWFTLDFGQQHVHAIREVPGPAFGVVPRSELVIRSATPGDLDALAELELVLPAHTRKSPVFSTLPLQTLAEVRAELAEDYDDPTYTWFLAEQDGKVVGSAIGCRIEISSSHLGPNRVAGAAFLGAAAVLPEARGIGAGKALGEATLAWSRDAGFSSIQSDWRSTNLEADRTWRSLGFRPTFRRLHRLVG
jgi:GNAT superfamily N-acetyltransferase